MAKLSPRDLWRLQVLADTATIRTGTFSIDAACGAHLKQLALARDQGRRIAVSCGRRAGKSTALCARAIDLCMTVPGAAVYYCSKSYTWAQSTIIDPILKPMLSRQSIAYDEDKADLVYNFPNGSRIYFLAADDLGDVKKFNGKKMHLCIVDEMQDLREDVLDLFLTVVVKYCLVDYDGTLILAGIPSEAPAGYWWDIWNNDRYSKHAFTMFDNPFRERLELEAWVDEDCREHGVTRDHAIIQRSVYGNWVPMTDWLVYKYDAVRNGRDCMFRLVDKYTRGWRYAVGVDTGSVDRFAIVVLGQSQAKPQVHLVDEFVTGHGADLDFTAAVNQLKAYRDKYAPTSWYFDPAHAGKPLMAELRNRHGFPLEMTANKNQLKGQVELVNDQLRNGTVRLPPDTDVAADMMKTLWDRDLAKANKWEYSSHWHPDPSEAFRYAFAGIYPSWHVAPDTRTARQRQLQEEQARIDATMVLTEGNVEADEVDERPTWARNPYGRR